MNENIYERLSSIYLVDSNEDPSLEFYKTPIGNYYLPSNAPNDVIMKSMRAGLIFDKVIIDDAMYYVREGTAVLDIGANFGQMSLLFSRAVGRFGKVFSFEAQEYVYNIFKKNIEANEAWNINALYCAVMDNSEGFVSFPPPDFKNYQSYGSYGIDPNGGMGPKVKKMKIDDLAIDIPISFMKIDIQGADLCAMRGARETIRKHKMPIIFEYEKEYDELFGQSLKDYMSFVEEIGYVVSKIYGGNNYLILPKS